MQCIYDFLQLSKPCYIITGSIARSETRRYLSYSETDFEVFRPEGATRRIDGVKFGVEDGTEGPLGPLLQAKFHPIGATIRV